MQLDLDLDRDLGDEESFDVEDCKTFTAFDLALLLNSVQCVMQLLRASYVCSG